MATDQTDIEDAAVKGWESELEENASFLRGQEIALEGLLKSRKEGNEGNHVGLLQALQRCRQARSRTIALQRLLELAPYTTREALDWSETHKDDLVQFNRAA